MTGIPKMIAFFIAIAFVIAFFKDMTTVAFVKEDFRGAVQSAAQTVAIKHMDWAALRVGDPPYLIQDGIEETVKNVVSKNLNMKTESMNVQMVSESTPAYIALTVKSNYDSTLLALLNQTSTLVEVPARVVEIIESKYTEYNY
ncbi:Transporter [Brevibacillus sp. IT-7CA2]|uniref:hypothetical protein n=1 Tax=Brevibacillus sp. IT-7CA2 TaxID=3026436 RepID=UPI0039DFBD7D